MGTRTEHAPGTFSWVDLTTSDAAGAKAFYGGVLGWEIEDSEIPGGGVYSMCMVDGEPVAAIAAETDRFPPHWNSYVTVASADDALARAKGLGATVIEEPFDVMTAGRMALFADPTGAPLCIWEAGDSIGAGRVNDPGCLTWNELHTPDPAAALEFYVGLFGWNTEELSDGEGPAYTVIKVGERTNGGVMVAQPGEPPNWMPYFTVESRDGALDEALRMGAEEIHRMEMGAGQTAILADPQGAVFGLFAGEVDD